MAGAFFAGAFLTGAFFADDGEADLPAGAAFFAVDARLVATEGLLCHSSGSALVVEWLVHLVGPPGAVSDAVLQERNVSRSRTP